MPLAARPRPPSASTSAALAPRAYPLALQTTTSYPLKPPHREAHELNVGADGRVYQEGRRYSTGSAAESRYVMAVDGTLYADRKERLDGKYPDNHSSFLGDTQPAAAAGEITAHAGVIHSIDNHSGHYAPTDAHTQQLFQELERRGLDTSSIQRTDVTRR